MKIFVVKRESDARKLISGSSPEALDRLQRFNPHLDLKKLAPGSVIVIPGPSGGRGSAAGDGKSIGAETMDSFIAFSKEALGVSARRLQQAAERAKSEESALASAAKSRGVGQAVEKDPELKKMLDEAIKQAKADTQAAAAETKNFDALAKTALAELEALAKRLA